MFVNFNDVFHPENKWKDKKLTDYCPCKNCETHKEYEKAKNFGSIAEREYACLPEYCNICSKKIQWQIDCMQKLAWYENNVDNKKEIPEELKDSFETIAKWLSQNNLYGTVTIHISGIGMDTGDIAYSVHFT